MCLHAFILYISLFLLLEFLSIYNLKLHLLLIYSKNISSLI